MKKLIIPFILLLLSVVTIGIQLWENYERISKEEAEGIALDVAQSMGYDSATLWKEFGNETRSGFVYSKEYNKDMKIWKVAIDTDEHPDILNTPALTYYISVDNGEVISIINAMEKN